MARSTEAYSHVAEDVLAHHENWYGSGYPRGLKGEAIPLLSRIIALVDAVEVMNAGRPYRRALSLDETFKELKRCSGSQFDPELVELLIETAKENGVIEFSKPGWS